MNFSMYKNLKIIIIRSHPRLHKYIKITPSPPTPLLFHAPFFKCLIAKVIHDNGMIYHSYGVCIAKQDVCCPSEVLLQSI